MSRFHGPQGNGPKASRRNKGVLTADRMAKRAEAVERNSRTKPGRRSTKRATRRSGGAA